MKRTLAQFAAACSGRLAGADAEFAEAVLDSRQLGRGDLFLALPGARTDGHEHVAAAAQAGAAGAVVSRPVAAALPQIVVADVARALTLAGTAWRGAFRGQGCARGNPRLERAVGGDCADQQRRVANGQGYAASGVERRGVRFGE